MWRLRQHFPSFKQRRHCLPFNWPPHFKPRSGSDPPPIPRRVIQHVQQVGTPFPSLPPFLSVMLLIDDDEAVWAVDEEGRTSLQERRTKIARLRSHQLSSVLPSWRATGQRGRREWSKTKSRNTCDSHGRRGSCYCYASTPINTASTTAATTIRPLHCVLHAPKPTGFLLKRFLRLLVHLWVLRSSTSLTSLPAAVTPQLQGWTEVRRSKRGRCFEWLCPNCLQNWNKYAYKQTRLGLISAVMIRTWSIASY